MDTHYPYWQLVSIMYIWLFDLYQWAHISELTCMFSSLTKSAEGTVGCGTDQQQWYNMVWFVFFSRRHGFPASLMYQLKLHASTCVLQLKSAVLPRWPLCSPCCALLYWIDQICSTRFLRFHWRQMNISLPVTNFVRLCWQNAYIAAKTKGIRLRGLDLPAASTCPQKLCSTIKTNYRLLFLHALTRGSLKRVREMTNFSE